MFSTGQHQLCMPTGQHQLCMLRTISNRIRIEYIWLQHMIQVRILGNNKGARHPQDLRQWPLSFLLCQTPAFLQQSFFPTTHQLPRTAHFIRFGRLIWLIVGMARSGIVTFHAMVVYTGQPGRVQWRVFPLADLAPGSRAIPPEVPEFSRKFYI